MKRIFTTFLVIFTLISTVSAQSIQYQCQKGDTISGICTKYQISIKELLKANPKIKNPSLIYPSTKLTIPENAPLQTLEDKVILLVNKERVKYKLPLLKKGVISSKVARLKSQDMVNKNYFSHTSPTYGSPFAMMESFGLRFSAAGENIAYGQKTPEEVMKAWMSSPGHRANILSKNYSYIGVGAAKKSNGTLYWTQEFVNPIT